MIVVRHLKEKGLRPFQPGAYLLQQSGGVLLFQEPELPAVPPQNHFPGRGFPVLRRHSLHGPLRLLQKSPGPGDVLLPQGRCRPVQQPGCPVWSGARLHPRLQLIQQPGGLPDPAHGKQCGGFAQPQGNPHSSGTGCLQRKVLRQFPAGPQQRLRVAAFQGPPGLGHLFFQGGEIQPGHSDGQRNPDEEHGAHAPGPADGCQKQRRNRPEQSKPPSVTVQPAKHPHGAAPP